MSAKLITYQLREQVISVCATKPYFCICLLKEKANTYKEERSGRRGSKVLANNTPDSQGYKAFWWW